MSGARRGILEPTIFAIVGIAILVGLGLWQLDRKAWKENLIATMTTRLARAPADLPPRDRWAHLLQAREEFARVGFPAEFLDGQEALVYSAGSAFRPDVKGPGYWVFAPARLAGGSIVIVDRGYVPLERKDPATRTQGAAARQRRHRRHRALAGDARPVHAGRRSQGQCLVPARHHGDRRRQEMGERGAVLYRAGSAGAAGRLAAAGQAAGQLPNNHLQYAITWFGLALALAGVYLVWLTRRLRRH